MEEKRLELKQDTMGLYDSAGKAYGFAEDHSKEGYITYNDYFGCREGGIRVFAKHLNRAEEISFVGLSKQKDLRTTAREQQYIDSQRVVHIYEEHLGWDKTEMSFLETKDKTLTAVWIKPSINWKTAPHTLSLFLMFMRSGYRLIENGMQCPCCIGDAIRHPKGISYDGGYYTNHHERFLPFLENLNKVYEGRTRHTNFSSSILTDKNDYSVGCEGIDKLCSGSSRDTETLARFREIIK